MVLQGLRKSFAQGYENSIFQDRVQSEKEQPENVDSTSSAMGEYIGSHPKLFQSGLLKPLAAKFFVEGSDEGRDLPSGLTETQEKLLQGLISVEAAAAELSLLESVEGISLDGTQAEALLAYREDLTARAEALGARLHEELGALEDRISHQSGLLSGNEEENEGLSEVEVELELLESERDKCEEELQSLATFKEGLELLGAGDREVLLEELTGTASDLRELEEKYLRKDWNRALESLREQAPGLLEISRIQEQLSSLDTPSLEGMETLISLQAQAELWAVTEARIEQFGQMMKTAGITDGIINLGGLTREDLTFAQEYNFRQSDYSRVHRYLTEGTTKEALELFQALEASKETQILFDTIQEAEKINACTINALTVVGAGGAARLAMPVIRGLALMGDVSSKAIPALQFAGQVGTFTVAHRQLNGWVMDQPFFDPNLSALENATALSQEFLFNAGMFAFLGMSQKLFVAVEGKALQGLAKRKGSQASLRAYGPMTIEAEAASSLVLKGLRKSPVTQLAHTAGSFGTELAGFGAWDYLAANLQGLASGDYDAKRIFAETLGSRDKWEHNLVFLAALKAGGALAAPVFRPMNKSAEAFAKARYNARLSELDQNARDCAKALEGHLEDPKGSLELLARYQASLESKLSFLRDLPSELSHPAGLALLNAEIRNVRELSRAIEAGVFDAPANDGAYGTLPPRIGTVSGLASAANDGRYPDFVLPIMQLAAGAEHLRVGADLRPEERPASDVGVATEGLMVFGMSQGQGDKLGTNGSMGSSAVRSDHVQGRSNGGSSNDIRTRWIEPKKGHSEGVAGLGEAIQFFSMPQSTNNGHRAFVAYLFLPTGEVVEFKVASDPQGSLTAMDGILTSPQGGTSRASIKKSDVGGNRFILEISRERSLEINLRPVAEKGIGIVRIELPRQQPEANQDISGFFPLQPRPFRQPRVLHSEMISQSTKRYSDAVTQKHIIYLSNGDKIELMVETFHHANGGMLVKYANWQMFGENPENAIELNSPDRKFTGGQKRLTLSNDKSGVQLSLQMDIPRYSRGGAVKILSAEIHSAPNPIWLRLGSGGNEQSQEVAGHQAIDAEVSLESLEIRISNGDLEAMNALAGLARENPQALNVLKYIYDLASEVEFGRRDFGGLPRQRVLEGLISSLQLAMGHEAAAEWLSSKADEAEISTSEAKTEMQVDTSTTDSPAPEASRETTRTHLDEYAPASEVGASSSLPKEAPVVKPVRDSTSSSNIPASPREKKYGAALLKAYVELGLPTQRAAAWLFQEVITEGLKIDKKSMQAINRNLLKGNIREAWRGLVEYFENRDGLEIWLFEHGFISEEQYLGAIKPGIASQRAFSKPGEAAESKPSQAGNSPAKNGGDKSGAESVESRPQDFFVDYRSEASVDSPRAETVSSGSSATSRAVEKLPEGEMDRSTPKSGERSPAHGDSVRSVGAGNSAPEVAQKFCREITAALTQKRLPPSKEAIEWLVKEFNKEATKEEKDALPGVRRALQGNQPAKAWGALLEIFEERDGLEYWLFDAGFIDKGTYDAMLSPARPNSGNLEGSSSPAAAGSRVERAGKPEQEGGPAPSPTVTERSKPSPAKPGSAETSMRPAAPAPRSVGPVLRRGGAVTEPAAPATPPAPENSPPMKAEVPPEPALSEVPRSSSSGEAAEIIAVLTGDRIPSVGTLFWLFEGFQKTGGSQAKDAVAEIHLFMGLRMYEEAWAELKSAMGGSEGIHAWLDSQGFISKESDAAKSAEEAMSASQAGNLTAALPGDLGKYITRIIEEYREVVESDNIPQMKSLEGMRELFELHFQFQLTAKKYALPEKKSLFDWVMQLRMGIPVVPNAPKFSRDSTWGKVDLTRLNDPRRYSAGKNGIAEMILDLWVVCRELWDIK